jgi:hydrogenase 3 maturation protease
MKIIVMCIGNTLSAGDDAVGSYIAKILKKEENPNFLVVDCGTAPENFTSFISGQRPDRLILIDAVDMNLEKGSVRIISPDKIGTMHISTHGIPIPILISYFKKYVKDIVFIGIQPQKMYGEKISEPVLKAAKSVISLIKNNKLNEIEVYT